MKHNQEEELEFLNAAGAVYAWMCAADGVVTVSESEGFAKFLNKLPYVNDITTEDFNDIYREILHAFEVDFEDGLNRAMVRIEPLKFNKKASRDLIKVAREALVADEKLEEAEEVVLNKLCSILEIDESEVP